MAAVLVNMAAAGSFIKGLAVDESHFILKHDLSRIDIDILTVETLIFVSFCINRPGRFERTPDQRSPSTDNVFDSDVSRITLDIIEQFTRYNAQSLLRTRRRLFVETLKAKSELSETFARILNASIDRSVLSDPMDTFRFSESQSPALDVIEAGLHSCLSNRLQTYMRALDRYSEQEAIPHDHASWAQISDLPKDPQSS